MFQFIFYWSRKSVQSLYGEDFSKSLIAFWQQIHTSWGRLQLLTLLTHLLRTQRSAIRDDYKSYDRHMLVQLSMYSAFLVVSEDRQFRNAFEFLHLLMDTIVTVQTASVDRRMKSGEESNSENGKLRLNKPHKKFNPYY